jgi:hypothetical protein
MNGKTYADLGDILREVAYSCQRQRLDDDTIRKLTEPLHRACTLLQRIEAKLDKMMRNEKEPKP